MQEKSKILQSSHIAIFFILLSSHIAIAPYCNRLILQSSHIAIFSYCNNAFVVQEKVKSGQPSPLSLLFSLLFWVSLGSPLPPSSFFLVVLGVAFGVGYISDPPSAPSQDATCTVKLHGSQA